MAFRLARALTRLIRMLRVTLVFALVQCAASRLFWSNLASGKVELNSGNLVGPDGYSSAPPPDVPPPPTPLHQVHSATQGTVCVTRASPALAEGVFGVPDLLIGKIKATIDRKVKAGPEELKLSTPAPRASPLPALAVAVQPPTTKEIKLVFFVHPPQESPKAPMSVIF